MSGNESAVRDTELQQSIDTDYPAWAEAMLEVARHYRLPHSEENLRITATWSSGRPVPDVLREMARQLGLAFRFDDFDPERFTPWRPPAIVQFRDGQIAVIQCVGRDGSLTLSLVGDKGLSTRLTKQEAADNIACMAILRPARSVPDARVDEYIKPHEPHWFARLILKDLKPYSHVMLASLMANTLALAGVLFSRQVYDRVIPSESFSTLYVLFTGVMVAMLFDFVLRSSRVRITDLLGKRTDMRASDRVFGHALRVKNSERPRSTGTFIAQIRELEHVRELLTSTTVTAFADLPFFFLFCLVMWYLAGPLVLVPMGALILLVVPGLLVQPRLRGLANEAMRESSLRSAMLVEAVQGLEDVKCLQAEQRFQQQWNHYNAVTADVNLKLRFIASTLSTWTHTLQNGVFAVVVLFGAPMVMEGTLSVGSLVAASILASRMMAPMSQITNVMSKWQQARVALNSLDQIMASKVDHPDEENLVHRPVISGDFQLTGAVFHYPGVDLPALTVESLTIAPGERIAVLGRNGAGKSTLLQALAGAVEARAGQVLLDGVNLMHIDPADVRRDIGLVSQNSRLFHGTVRENLLLGAPHANDNDILAALEASGAAAFIRKLPRGLDHLIQEGGLGLSGGQRQSLLLSRLLLRQPQILLLDEPTAALDDATEKRFVQHLGSRLDGRTLIVATHRPSVLSIVDRIIMVENGRIVLDDSREKVLSMMGRKAAQPAQEAAS